MSVKTLKTTTTTAAAKRARPQPTTVKRAPPTAEFVDDEIPADMLEFVENASGIIVKRQDERTASEGELQIKATFKTYLQLIKNRNEEVSAPPPTVMERTRDGKKTYPKNLVMKAKARDFTTIPDVCTPLPEGNGWRVRANVSYKEEARDWLAANCRAAYDGTYTGKFPVCEYVSKDGELATSRFITIYHNAEIKIKAPDNKDTVFRRRNATGTGYEVVPRTNIKFSKCTADIFVALREDDDATTEDAPVAAAVEGGAAPPAASDVAPVPSKAKTFTPVAYPSFSCKGGVDIADDHDPTICETERLHVIESKDTHNMIPIPALRRGDALSETVYFWVANRYQTTFPAEQGVSIFKLKVESLADLIGMRDDVPVGRCNMRVSLFQWYGSPAATDTRESYTVKLIGDKEVWRSFGIPDPNMYAAIYHANPDIPCHVDARLWKAAVLNADINRPDVLNNREELKGIHGHYTYGAQSVLPDYLRWLPRNAVRISQERVETEFSEWMGTAARGTKTTMHLMPAVPTKENPLHAVMGLNSPVIALGNGQVDASNPMEPRPLYHAVAGNVWPIVESSDFYVLTSHPLTSEERAQYCGGQGGGDLTGGDAFLDKLIETEQVFYCIFAVNRDAAAKAVAAEAREREIKRATADALRDVLDDVPVKKQAVTVAHVEEDDVPVPVVAHAEEEEELAEDEPSSSSMDIEPEDEEEPTPPPRKPVAAVIKRATAVKK